MITWLIGENSFEVHEALQALTASFSGTPERIDGAALAFGDLPELLMGVSLFAADRLVVIHDITQNTEVWPKLAEWLPRVSDSIHLVLVDAKPDKRTAGYKALKKVATVRELPAWTEKDTAKAMQWLSDRAQVSGVALSGAQVRHIIERVGVDQWQLASALDKIALLEVVTLEAIDALVPQNLQENVFQLFESALDGNMKGISTAIASLTLQEDPYGIFALLSSQVLTLAAVAFSGPQDDPAKDFAIHPYAAGKMARHAKRLGRAKVGYVLELFARADADLKRSKAEPWFLVEKTLLAVAAL